MKTLVIVESPAKAKTISKYLGSKYVVKSSFGHIRDLPKRELGIDIENNFEPQYTVSREKMKIVKELKTAAAKVDKVLFATDEDREGEAISWHLSIVLGIDPKKVSRIAFHEITKDAIEKALENPRKLDMKMVDAQQARRVLDRLVGYELSPFLWRKIAKGLSAGRVQSVAVRLVVEREREIKNFNHEEYWSVEGEFSAAKTDPFAAKLTSTPKGKLDKMDLKNQAAVDVILADLKGASYAISNTEEKLTSRQPSPPFTTSTLQQEANHRLGFSAKQTMRVAQQLYEGVELGPEGSVGLITYMRTDSMNLSEKFLQDAKTAISGEFGEKYYNGEARVFKTKSKNAQEAHEAVRPTEAARDPETIKDFLDSHQYRLYDLIWRRALATQMAPAKINNAVIDIESKNNYTFRANGQNIVFEGFLKLYPEKTKENLLPKVENGAAVDCKELKPEQHFTEPPGRYSDATLVKALEEFGIGRPSTYAPTIATIEDRGYVERDEKKKLFPREIAYLVNDLLVAHFPNIVDFKFTAQMEEDLDQIADGEKKWQPIIADFYKPFKDNLIIKDKELSKKELTEEKTDEVCDKCGSPMVIKVGRFGKFMACSGYPKCKNTKPLPGEEGAEASPAAEPINEACDKCGAPMVRKIGRFGPFISCSAYPKCKNIKNIEIKLNLKCPKCGTGEIIERKTKRGKKFYGCNRYPDCDFALWDRPNGEACTTCKKPMVFGKKGSTVCSNKECPAKK
ncbi:MAG: type I DNA topoisomerase [Candidatus Magasanikbacteria bacterium]|nr:type I DNA topoisomerase [Candidatus Magasanikbacteria bacterium]